MRAKVQEANQPEAPTSKTPRRPLFTIGSRKPSSSPPATTSQKYPEASLLPQSAEKHAKRVSVPETGKQPRWVSQSGVRKGLVKEVSGGMVVYTAPNRGSKATRPKPTAQPPWRDRKSRRESRSSSWHMDNMCDIAHEVSLLRFPPPCPALNVFPDESATRKPGDVEQSKIDEVCSQNYYDSTKIHTIARGRITLTYSIFKFYHSIALRRNITICTIYTLHLE